MRKRLGQHFLKNQGVASTIVKTLSPQTGEVIIEIGPGRGALTRPLLAACEEQSVRLLAIERDEQLAGALEEELPKGNYTIIRGDALILLPNLVKTIAPAQYKIVGNIPYYITGHLLRTIGELEHMPMLSILMLQKEVAERIAAEPPAMNRLAAHIQIWAKPFIIGRVSKKEFDPPPDVDSAVVSLKTYMYQWLKTDEPYAASIKKYRETVNALFAQPRKTIMNNVSAACGDFPKNELQKLLLDAGIDPLLRPQNLTIEQIATLSSVLFNS